MRIISGKFRGRRFAPPLSKCNTRPTMDMAKEALFNILYNQYDFHDIKVLDLFGGTGSISFEFASRGCNDIVWVDKSYVCYKFVNDVVRQLKLSEEIKTHKFDTLKYLDNCKDKFDIIFADPPYNYPHYNQVIEKILDNKLLNPNGYLIVEHDKNRDFSTLPNFVVLKQYGTNNFSFFSEK